MRRSEQPPGATPFRSLGTHSVWYPRGLLLRVAARHVCDALIRDWEAIEYGGSSTEIEQFCARALHDPGLRWEALSKQIERAAYTPDGTPPEIVARMITELVEEAGRPEVSVNPATWAEQAVAQFEEWVGSRATGADDSVLRRSRFSVVYTNAVNFVAEDWEKRLMGGIAPVMDRPGRRTAAMEVALTHLIMFCDQAVNAQSEVVERHREMVRESRDQLRRALDLCRGGAGALG